MTETKGSVDKVVIIEDEKEIGEMLKMAESTSRANLSLANGLLREKLRKML